MNEPAHEIPVGTVVDRYVIEGVIGAGGMATVYRVRHAQLGSEHALKVIPTGNRTVRDRLLQEGRMQAVLRHPNIVAVTDVIEVGGAPGLIMEIVRGPSLQALLARRPLTLEQSDVLAEGVLQGVAEAHRHEMIHRDLKPANVLLEVARGTITPKVADFGLAKALAAAVGGVAHTRSGATLGTPAYMAPEQVRDARGVDRRADVFSLGAVLYEMVTGQRAFPGPDMITVYQAIADGRYAPVRRFVPSVPDRMERAIVAALEPDLHRRAPDCEALLELWVGSRRRAGSSPWAPADLAGANALGARPVPLAPLAAEVEQSMGGAWQEDPSSVFADVTSERPTVLLPIEDAMGIEPPSLVSEQPPTDVEGETTMVHRIRRQYGLVAAVAAVVFSAVAVLAVGMLAIVLLAQLMGPSSAPDGPGLDAAMPLDR